MLTNPENATLRGIINTAGPQTVIWDGADNYGEPFPLGLEYPVRIQVRGGEYHLPLFDVENNGQGGPTLELINPPGAYPPEFIHGVHTGFYDDRMHTTLNGTIVDTLTGTETGIDNNEPLCGIGAPLIPFSDPITGYDTRTTDRAFGDATLNRGGNSGTPCAGAFGDTKGLDMWTYFPSEFVETHFNIIEPPSENQLILLPSTTLIEPQIDNTLIVDLFVIGLDLYGLEVTITVDPNILTLTGGSYGEFFDPDQRLEIPPSLDALNGTWGGAITLQIPAAPITGSGDGYFASLSFAAADTTATGTVDATALFAGFRGEMLTGSIYGTTIEIDNGEIGTISGQLSIPGAQDSGGIVVTLTNSATGSTSTVRTDSEGNFTFGGLSDGTYTWSAYSTNHVLGCSEVTVNADMPVVLEPAELYGGDLTGDGFIDIADFALAAGSFGLSEGDEDYNPAADINSDGTVNIYDLCALGSGFGIDAAECL